VISAQEVKFETVREVAKLVRDFIIKEYGDSGGMCIDATRYLTKLLALRKVEFKAYEGRVYFEDNAEMASGYHVWLEVDGIIVDVTADQFNTAYVEKPFPAILIGSHEEYPQFKERTEITFTGESMEWLQPVGLPESEKFNVGPLPAMAG
jgi:hypothetical protein